MGTREFINYICQPWIEHGCLFPTVGQYKAQSVSAIIDGIRFGIASFTLPLVPDYVPFLALFHQGIPIDVILILLFLLFKQLCKYIKDRIIIIYYK